MQKNLSYIHIHQLGENQDNFTFDGQLYHVLWITAGEGRIRINFKEYELIPHRIFYIASNEKGTILHATEKGYLVTFSEDLLLAAIGTKKKAAILAWITHPYTYFDMEDAQVLDFKSLWDMLTRNVHRQGAEPFIAKIIHLIWTYPQLIPTSPSGIDYPSVDVALIKRLKICMEKHFKEHKESSFYADQLQVPLWKLNRLCKQMLGSTVHEILLDRIIIEAKRLLLTTSQSIKEINFELGFKDPSYFNKVFRRLCGVSPRAYRTNKRKIVRGGARS